MAMLGMRGTGDWVPNQRKLSWREMILKLYPNGKAPLTAMLSKMKSSSVDDPTFNWWSQIFSSVQGPVEAVSLTGAATAGTTFTIDLGTRTDAADVGAMPKPPIPPDQPAGMPDGLFGGVTSPNRFVPAGRREDIDSFITLIRPGHQILLLNTTNAPFAANAKVVSLTPAVSGNGCVITLRLLEDVTAAAAGINYFKVIGNINSEGGEMPDAISLDPQQLWNNTQIFRTPLSMTRTAMKTRLRTPDQYQRSKSEALEMHSVELELAFLFGQQSVRVGTNNQPERTTLGWVNFVKKYAPINVFDCAAASNPSGVVQNTGGWTNTTNGITNGERFLDDMFEFILRWGPNERLIMCGNGVVKAINQIPKVAGSVNIAPKEQTYGLRIMEWITPFGTFNLMTHPLFNNDPVLRNTALIMDPSQLEYRYIDDTEFYGENGKTRATGTGHNRIDGIKEEYLTEAGLEFGMPMLGAIVYNFGKDRP